MMAAGKGRAAKHAAHDLFQAIGVRDACPLISASASASIRWHGYLPGVGRVWIDLDAPTDMSSTTQSPLVSGRYGSLLPLEPRMEQSDIWVARGCHEDIHGKRSTVALAFPPNGLESSTGFDWQVAQRMMRNLSTSAQSATGFGAGLPILTGHTDLHRGMYGVQPEVKQRQSFCSEWMAEHAHLFCARLDLPGIVWEGRFPNSGEPERHIQSRQVLRHYSTLGCETVEGAIWRLHAPTDLLCGWWRQSVNPCRNDVSPGLLRQTLSAWLMLELPVLSRDMVNRLEPASVIILDTSSADPFVTVRAKLQTSACHRAGPFHFRAALDLCVMPGSTTDRIEVRWRSIMSLSEYPLERTIQSPLAVTESIATRLTCVIAEVSLSLEDLLHLQKGDLLPCAAVLSPLVQLRVGEQQVGTGELVKLGGGLAVQLLEWNLTHTNESAQKSAIVTTPGEPSHG